MKRILVRIAIVLTLLTAPAFSGGWFIITLGQPSAHSDPRAHSAAFVVRVYGCSALAAHVSATAEGLVNGSRQSVPLTPIPLSGGRSSVVFSGDTRFVEEWPSFSVAIPPEWSPEGTWLVKVVAHTPWRSQSALVVVRADGFDRTRTRLKDTFSPTEVDAALHTLESSPAEQTAGH